MGETLRIEEILPCEWWVLRAGFLAIADLTTYHGRFIANGWEFDTDMDLSSPDGAINTSGGIITLTAGKTNKETRVVIEDLWGVQPEYWRAIFRRLESFVLALHDVRRKHVSAPKTPDEAIEYYYRARAAGAKVTLRDVATGAGLSYEAVRKHKQRYDRAGKWGSKKETKVSPK